MFPGFAAVNWALNPMVQVVNSVMYKAFRLADMHNNISESTPVWLYRLEGHHQLANIPGNTT